jgi:hypothetical protein
MTVRASTSGAGGLSEKHCAPIQKLQYSVLFAASASGGSGKENRISMEFFEGGVGGTFLHKKVPPTFFRIGSGLNEDSGYSW